MDKKKIIYIGIILIVTVITSITYFSYAFFVNKDEQLGKLNIVAGTLNYKVSSSLLNNNSITLAAYEKARLNIEIESLNNINSKYELYYTTTNNSIEIGYSTDNQQSSGIINANSKRIVTVIIKNPTSSNAVVTFGVQGGFTNNALSLSTSYNALTQYSGNYCEIANNTEYLFDYNGTDGSDGSVQSFNTGCSGIYKLETWGAQGGTVIHNDVTAIGGYGGYSIGNAKFNGNTTLYITVGGSGSISNNGVGVLTAGGYNGGGANTQSKWGIGGSGGGATHIATISGLLSQLEAYKSTNGENISNEILMVAGGGGAGGVESSTDKRNTKGGSGGGKSGVDGKSNCNDNFTGCPSTGGTGGTQTSGAFFGRSNDNTSWGGTGGAGWYGGTVSGGGGGGSGYIGNSSLKDKKMYCYECTESSEPNTYTVSTTTGLERDTTNCPNGYSSIPIPKCAKSGNGYAKVTYISEFIKEVKEKINYIITFNANGGTSSTTKNVKAGTAIGILPIAKKDSKQFEGWYLESTLTTKVNQNYVPTGDITLYAKYNLD